MSRHRVTLFSFSFGHHGRFSSFHRLLHYSRDCRAIDITLPLLWRAGDWLQPRLERRWRQLNEWRLRPVFGRRGRQCVHYLYPENSLFHGGDWKGRHGLVLSCHQPGAKLRQDRDSLYYSGFFRGLERADRVVLLASKFMHEYAGLCNPASLRVIPHGIDVDYFRPAETKAEKPLVLTVGNWLRDYDLWAEAVLELALEFPETTFVAVAMPMAVESVRAKVAGRLAQRIRFVYGLNDFELLQLYRRATLLFLPLKDAGANNAVLEAMACGVPLALTDLPATREYADEAAVYFRPGSLDDCVQQVGRILRDRSARERLGVSGRLRAERQFAWEAIAEHYAKLYREVLNES